MSSLAFALQHHFENVKAPVPGAQIFDQISRPYFPSKSENEDRDEAEIVGGGEDEDIGAMRKHVGRATAWANCAGFSLSRNRKL